MIHSSNSHSHRFESIFGVNPVTPLRNTKLRQLSERHAIVDRIVRVSLDLPVVAFLYGKIAISNYFPFGYLEPDRSRL